MQYVDHLARTCPLCKGPLEAGRPPFAPGAPAWFAQVGGPGSEGRWRSVTPPPEGAASLGLGTWVCPGPACGAVVYVESL